MTAEEFSALRPGDRIRLSAGWCGDAGGSVTHEVTRVNKCGTIRTRVLDGPFRGRAGKAVTPAAWVRA